MTHDQTAFPGEHPMAFLQGGTEFLQIAVDGNHEYRVKEPFLKGQVLRVALSHPDATGFRVGRHGT